MLKSIRKHVEQRKVKQLYRVSGMTMARKDRLTKFLRISRIILLCRAFEEGASWLFRVRSFVWHSGMHTFSVTVSGFRSLLFVVGFSFSVFAIVLLLQGLITRQQELQVATEEIAELKAIFANLRDELDAAKSQEEPITATASVDMLIERTEEYERLLHAFRVDGEFIRTRGRLVNDIGSLKEALAEERFSLYQTEEKLSKSEENTALLYESEQDLKEQNNRLQDELIDVLQEHDHSQRVQQDFLVAIDSYLAELERVTGKVRPDDDPIDGLGGTLDYLLAATTEVFDFYARQDTLLRQAEQALNDDISRNYNIIAATEFPLKKIRGASIIQTGLGGPIDGDIIPVGGNEHVYRLEGLRAMQDEIVTRIEVAHFLQKVRNCMPVGRPILTDERVSSKYGVRRDPFLHKHAFHYGIDYSIWYGNDIVATGPGVVVRSGFHGGYGRLVEIDHGCGFKSRYAHLQRFAVRKGETVNAGQKIGESGNSGRSTGPHLHYEVLYNNRQLNPITFVEALEYAK
ncbi:MAG: peptidoglycan DD-metalloendopeptidase family protein [Alphaproteobacteria bacterium]|nr:peptidoglycan DD-metalloendopeptidase family protein [Alphaproteobacteria bacterium]